MADLEQNFMCSGVCSNPGFFVYSNINNGKPTTTCFDALQSYIVNQDLFMLGLSTAITIVIAVVMGLIVLVVGFLTYRRCKSKKDSREKKVPAIENEESDAPYR